MSGSSNLEGAHVLVAGAGVSGIAAALALLDIGADVTVTDQRAGDGTARLADAGAEVALGLAVPPADVDLVVTSPGWRPDSALLLAAADAGTEVIGEAELAWRLRGPNAGPWLTITGTNGKTTTVRMLESMLLAAGYRAVAAGNVGLALVEAVRAPVPYEVLAVELSSYQLHWSSSIRPLAGTILNIAPDHLDWHGSLEAYAADKARVWTSETVAVANADDPVVAELHAAAPGKAHVTFTLDSPRPGQLGMAGDNLTDRAFAARGLLAGAGSEPTTLLPAREVNPPGPHNIANALAAAALARAFGLTPAGVAEGLRAFVPEPHRNVTVGVVDDVRYVDDSKATNPHAAAASLASYPSIVWIAGGLNKGLAFDDLVVGAVGRLRGAVVLGQCREEVATALARHAPGIPVVEVNRMDDEAMSDVVRSAARLAQPGDTVLLAPAVASMDMFRDYKHRGEAFEHAVAALGGNAGAAQPGQAGSGQAGSDLAGPARARPVDRS